MLPLLVGRWMLLVNSLGMEVWAWHILAMGTDKSKVISKTMCKVFIFNR